MDTQMLRLACLELAVKIIRDKGGPMDVVALAGQLYDFIIGGRG